MSYQHLPVEGNYKIYDKELLVIVQAFKKWHPELDSLSQPINVIFDYKNLKYFMFFKQLSRRQARRSKILSRFNFKINYKPGSQCKANALTRKYQDWLAGSDSCQDYMEQVVLKPKNLNIVQSIQILRWGDIGPIDAMKQNLKSAINKTYQEIDSKNPIAIINQMIINRAHYSHHYSLLDYSLENRRLYHYSKLYLPNKNSLRLCVLQESYDQPMAGYFRVAKTYKIFQCLYYWLKIVETIC